jgi:peroxiredoxin
MPALSLLLKQVTDQESTNKDIILFSHPDAQTVNQAFTQITNFSEYLPATTKEAGLISEIYLNYQQHQQWKQPQPYDAFEL